MGSRRTSVEIEELRNRIAELWVSSGLTVAEIARQVGCTRKMVYTVIQRLNDPEADLRDRRRSNNGRLPVIDKDPLCEAIAAIRSRHPEWGPMMIRHELKKHPDLYGISQIPSQTTIACIIRELGLARKKVGPRDTRVYPDIERPSAPGFCTIDLWGPWHLRATNLYLVTVQDRYTRLSACVPARSLLYEHETHPGVASDHWIKAIAVYLKYLLPQGSRPKRLYTDNGVGIVPAFGMANRTLKYALRAGFTVVFIPPGQPWRNGKLERFHWTLKSAIFNIPTLQPLE